MAGITQKMTLQSRLKGLVGSTKDKDGTRHGHESASPVGLSGSQGNLQAYEQKASMSGGLVVVDHEQHVGSTSEDDNSVEMGRSQGGDSSDGARAYAYTLSQPKGEGYSEFGGSGSADNDNEDDDQTNGSGQSGKELKSNKGKLAKWKSKAKQTGGKLMVLAAEKKQGLAGDWSEFKEKHRKKEGGGTETAKVFGVTLEHSLSHSQIDSSCPLPAVVIRCIEFLEGRVGLYRIPGSTTAVGKLKSTFDTGQDLDLFLHDPPVDPHAVATLLKLFLRELPENVLGDLLGSFNSIVALESDPLPLLAALARQLPIPNYYLMSWLSSHLSRLVYFSHVNKMTLNNLALIFCPTLHIDTQLFTLIVEHPTELFPLDEDGNIPDEVYKVSPSATAKYESPMDQLDRLSAEMLAQELSPEEQSEQRRLHRQSRDGQAGPCVDSCDPSRPDSTFVDASDEPPEKPRIHEDACSSQHSIASFATATNGSRAGNRGSVVLLSSQAAPGQSQAHGQSNSPRWSSSSPEPAEADAPASPGAFPPDPFADPS